MPDVFLSYSREDQATARVFAEALQRAGFLVWWDQSLRSGEAFDRVTEKALEESRAVVVLWSKASVESRWVRAEATQADRAAKLVPAMIEPCKRPIMFELTHTADLTGWRGELHDERWQGFVRDLRAITGERTHFEVHTDRPNSEPAVKVAVAPGRRYLLPAVAALAILLGGVAFWVYAHKQNPSSIEAATESPSAANPAARESVTLAVLPFVNLSSDPEQEYFSDGLTEEILNQLAQVRRLSVTGRTSSFSFKGKNEDLREIGRQLGVAHLLEGSVRKDGHQLRITAQLIDAGTGAQLWSNTYDRELSKVFALQEDLAKDVAAALSITLDVGELTRAQGGTTNVAAYEKYMQGVGGINKATGKQRLRLFRDAVALDPDFALAWYRIYAGLPALANGQPAAESAATLRERAEIGTRLEKLLPREGNLARLYRSARAFDERRWSEVFAELEAARAATPDDATVTRNLAIALRSVGRSSDAIPYLQRLRQADPLGEEGTDWLARVNVLAGRLDQADALGVRLLSGNSGSYARLFYDLWTAPFRTGPRPSWPEVSAKLSAMGKQLPPEVPVRKLFLASASHPDDVEAARAELRTTFAKAMSEGELSMLTFLADQAGDSELTVAALRRNYVDMKSGWLPNLWERTVASGARETPEFRQLLRDLKIVDYWRATGNWGDFCKPVGTTDFECH